MNPAPVLSGIPLEVGEPAGGWQELKVTFSTEQTDEAI
jgi:hypothetical protein